VTHGIVRGHGSPSFSGSDGLELYKKRRLIWMSIMITKNDG
jgi:hypothetical protein